MNYLHARIAMVVMTLGFSFGAFAGCTSCPKGTKQVNGACERAAPEELDPPMAGRGVKTETVSTDPETGGTDNAGGTGGTDPGTTAAPECAGRAGKAVCDAQGKLSMCDEAGVATVIAECESAELCEAGLSAGSCAMCIAGEAKCDGAMLTRCAADGSAYTLESDCKSAALCDEAKGTCKTSACEADGYMCDGDRLNVCKADLTGYQFSKQCPPGLCDAERKDCKQCSPGAMKCDDDKIMICDSSGEAMEAGPTCEGQTPVCDEQRGCVECKIMGDCTIKHDCADLSGCNVGRCEFVAKPRRTSVGDGSLVREGNPDPDPIYVVFGGALFYVSTPEEVDGHGGFGSVQIRPLNYSRCPVQGTLITERGDPVGYIYQSDGKQLNWVKSPTDLEMYCGGSANILTVPSGSLTVTSYPPPAGLCPINRN